jgi:hypothetical protein
MTTKQKIVAHKQASPRPKEGAAKDTCFVISPIGDVGTERHAKFKEVLEYVIKRGIKDSGYDLQVLRADDIDRAGSFIKDILGSIYNSHVVIADLTEQNPNVFYELGVRHALRPRTILIAQSIDDIPSDLREYRTIVYDTSAKGAADFFARLRKLLSEIQKEPERPDNPVLDRIGSIFGNAVAALKAEKEQLKNSLDAVLRRGQPKETKATRASAYTRLNRITNLIGAKRQFLGGQFTRGDESYMLPEEQGEFELYFVSEGKNVNEFWYVAEHSGAFDYKEDLADVRVLMQNCVDQGGVACKFVIATNDDLSRLRKDIMAIFHKMKAMVAPEHREKFALELWDNTGLLKEERQLGLKID